MSCSQQNLSKTEINLLLNNIETTQDVDYFKCIYGETKWYEFTSRQVESRCIKLVK
jgi:hypothetical protein